MKSIETEKAGWDGVGRQGRDRKSGREGLDGQGRKGLGRAEE